MTEEPPSAGTRAAPASPSSSASGTLPYPLWMLFGLGALACVAWFGAVLVDLWAPAAGLMPIWLWLRSAMQVVLVLAVPTLILTVMRSPRLPARRHARAFVAVEALLMLLVALPALLPYTTPTDLTEVVSLPLRLPTVSLGVALAAVDPLVSERWRESRDRDSSTAVVAGAGFGAVVLAAALIVLVPITHPAPSQCTGAVLACGGLLNLAISVLCGGAFVCVLAGLLGAWLGYVLGAMIARSVRWR